MKLRLRRSFAFILALVLAAASLSLAASASSAVPGLHGDLVPYRNYTGETTELIAYSELEPFAGKYYYPSTQGYLAYLVAPEEKDKVEAVRLPDDEQFEKLVSMLEEGGHA